MKFLSSIFSSSSIERSPSVASPEVSIPDPLEAAILAGVCATASASRYTIENIAFPNHEKVFGSSEMAQAAVQGVVENPAKHAETTAAEAPVMNVKAEQAFDYLGLNPDKSVAQQPSQAPLSGSNPLLNIDEIRRDIAKATQDQNLGDFDVPQAA